MTVSKDNAHVLANPQEFQAAYLRAIEFFGRNPTVVSVGFGQKHAAGRYDDEIAIIVFVREKRSADALAPEQRIPPSFEGYRTDVVVVPVGSLAVCDNSQEYSTIQGGIQIMPHMPPGATPFAGTLTSVVHRRGDSSSDNVFLLSCWHVLFGDIANKVGDYIYHPNPPPAKPSNPLGAIQEGAIFANKDYTYIVNNAPATTRHFLDCGVARINVDSEFCGSTCHDQIKTAATIIDLGLDPTNTIADVRDCLMAPEVAIKDKKVIKVGRTTGRTVGLVRRINCPVDIKSNPNVPASPLMTALGLIEIDFDTADPSQPTGVNCKGLAWFVDHGDSGSLVLDEQRRAIGMITLGPSANLPDGQPNTAPSPSYACHIMPVLDHLHICLPSAGASPGSSSATDGTGRAPVTTPAPDRSTLPSGEMVFLGQERAASLLASRRITRPLPVNDEHLRHMRELLAQFRQTPAGSQWQGMFGELRREVGYLVRNSRPVKVAWMRNKGPAFFAHVLNHLAGHTDSVPHEVQGVTRRVLLVRMCEVLSANGSNPLREALARHGDELLEMFTREECNSVADCIEWLEERELA
ncbi:MAG: hypothetical protein WDO56_05940 [Gammaproteobacteria bacterium]